MFPARENGLFLDALFGKELNGAAAVKPTLSESKSFIQIAANGVFTPFPLDAAPAKATPKTVGKEMEPAR